MAQKVKLGLVRVRLNSRHLSSRSYQLWIKHVEVSKHGTVNAELGQESLGCVSTLQPFYGFWKMRGRSRGTQVDLKFGTGDTL